MVVSLDLEYFSTVATDPFRILKSAANWSRKDKNIVFGKRFMSDHVL